MFSALIMVVENVLTKMKRLTLLLFEGSLLQIANKPAVRGKDNRIVCDERENTPMWSVISLLASKETISDVSLKTIEH